MPGPGQTDVQLILRELDKMQQQNRDMDTKIEDLRDQITTLREDTAGLKVRAGIWGVVSGAIPVLLAIIVRNFKGLLG